MQGNPVLGILLLIIIIVIQDCHTEVGMLIIKEYGRITGLCSYYGILGTRDSGADTPSQLAITVLLIIVKVLSFWF